MDYAPRVARSGDGATRRDSGAHARPTLAFSADRLVDEFVASLVKTDGDDRPINEALAGLRGAGWTCEAVLLTLFTAAARRLGDDWLSDRLTFVDVTVAVHRLTVQLLAFEREEGATVPCHGGRVLLSSAPDDQHVFGLLMVGFFLRRAGWTVSTIISGDTAQVVDCIKNGGFTVIGLSVGHERAIAPLTNLIDSVRAAARPAGITVAVGGPAILGRPQIATILGADMTATDAVDLVAQLEAVRPPGPLLP